MIFLLDNIIGFMGIISRIIRASLCISPQISSLPAGQSPAEDLQTELVSDPGEAGKRAASRHCPVSHPNGVSL